MSKVADITIIDRPLTELFKRKRKSLGLSMQRVSQLSGVGLPTLLQFESGQRKGMAWYQMVLACQVLEISLDQLAEYATAYNSATTRATLSLKAQYAGQKCHKMRPQEKGIVKKFRTMQKKVDDNKKKNAELREINKALASKILKMQNIKKAKKARLQNKRTKELAHRLVVKRREERAKLEAYRMKQIAIKAKEKDQAELRAWVQEQVEQGRTIAKATLAKLKAQVVAVDGENSNK